MNIGYALNFFFFGIYPYIALSVLLLGSLVRYDRDGYTWKSDSSQLLRAGELQWGSNLFHYGVLVVVFGHFVGFLMPEPWIDWMMSPTQHQLLAMITGGIFGTIALIGIAILLHRRFSDPRIRLNSRAWDMAIALMLALQLLLGLLTIPFSAQHMDGHEFVRLIHYVQGICIFRPDVANLLIGTPIIYRLHIFLGFTIFLVSPFTRLVHIWSGIGSLAYAVRPYQLVRTRRKSLKS